MGRTIIAVFFILFARLDHNPVVRLEALLGISPSPFEKLFGLAGPFSGMTEGIYQLFHGNFGDSVNANMFSPLIALGFLAFVMTGAAPRIRTKRDEFCAFAILALMTICNNLAKI